MLSILNKLFLLQYLLPAVNVTVNVMLALLSRVFTCTCTVPTRVNCQWFAGTQKAAIYQKYCIVAETFLRTICYDGSNYDFCFNVKIHVSFSITSFLTDLFCLILSTIFRRNFWTLNWYFLQRNLSVKDDVFSRLLTLFLLFTSSFVTVEGSVQWLSRMLL